MNPPISDRAEILQRFMQGEIDAESAVARLKKLPLQAFDEYVAWPEGEFSNEQLLAKLAELRSAWQTDDAGPAA